MTKRNKLAMTRKELLQLKTMSVAKLNDETVKLTKRQRLDVEELVETIDEILTTIEDTETNETWQRIWEILKIILTLGGSLVVKSLTNKNK